MLDINITTTGFLKLPAPCESIIEVPASYIGAPFCFACSYLSTTKSV